MIVRAPDATLGTVALAGVVPKLSATPGEVRYAGKETGEDTREVLADILGLTDAEVNGLLAEGVIACSAASAGSETAADMAPS